MPTGHVSRVRQFYALTKPRVVQLIVFCAVIGMLLAVPGVPDWRTALAATAGIWLVAGAAAAFNCIVEQRIDAKMARTAWRPTAKGELTNAQTLSHSRALLCAAGSALLYFWVNPLTMWLTLGHVRRLRGRLHGDPQTADAAEHRDRRRFRARCRRCSAGRRCAAKSGPRR